MNEDLSSSTADMTAMLDRLVCGELDDAARRQLIRWMEQDALRWRLCGLLFLESQAWSQAIGDESPPHENQPSRNVNRLQITTARRRSFERTLFLAISVSAVFIAFIVGLAMGGSTSPLPSDRSVAVTPAAATSGDQTVESDVQTAASETLIRQAHPVEIPEYVRHQWERRGFKLIVQQRYIFGKLPDGQNVAVPVNQVTLNPVPLQIN